MLPLGSTHPLSSGKSSDLADTPVEQLIDALNEHFELEPLRHILCSTCKTPITTADHRIELQHSHYHRFANPSGITFNIACFSEAFGCIISGEPTLAFSWFPGFYWQYTFCEHCETHLGWYYQAATNNYFYGLIVDKLVFERKT
jgi:hypothetical protein